jgi:gamma-glutamyltranspeptidase/glutathione hydrolase
MLEALNILEGYDLRAMGRNSAPYLHAVTEALKLSFADRNAFVGDPKFVPDIPMAQLLSKEYAAARRSRIDPNRAIAGEPAPGDPRGMNATAAGRPGFAPKALRRGSTATRRRSRCPLT